MEEFLGEMNFGFEIDSVMMRLLRSAMDKADQNLRSKRGPIEKLTEQSNFYELAIIQLEGSLKIIQEETDNYSLESSHEKIISDLMEIEDRLKRRLKETKLAISRIDAELMMRSDHEVENRTDLGVHEGKERDIRELKNSVDLQVLNIKQKLEDERVNFSSGMRKMSFEPDHETLSEERNWGDEREDVESYGNNEFEVTPANYSLRLEQNIVIEQMSSDIDILKGTLDLTFGRMQKAEAGPLEKQWRWTIEKETMSILIRGFMSDLEGKFGGKLGRKGNEFPLGLWNEITSLHSELKSLTTPNEVQIISVKGQENPNSSPNVRRTSSEPLPEVDYTEDLHEENLAADRSHYVAKMIKNHESIIRKQRKDFNWLKRQVLQGKECLSMNKEKDSNGFEGRIQEVIVRLENAMKWKPKLEERKFEEEKGNFQEDRKSNFDKERMEVNQERDDSILQRKYEEEKGNFQEDRKSNFDKESTEVEQERDDSILQRKFEEERGNFQEDRKSNFDKEIMEVEQERDDSILQITNTNETYITLMKGLMKDFNFELSNYDSESLIRDDICFHALNEIVKDWRRSFESKIFDAQISNDIYVFVCNEATKDFVNNHESQIVENMIREDLYGVIFREMDEERKKDMEKIYRISLNETEKSIETLMSQMKEEVHMVFLREMVKERKIEREAYNFENLIREEIYNIVIFGAAKDVHEKFSKDLIFSENLERNSNIDREENVTQRLEKIHRISLSETVRMIKEGVYVVFLREMIKEREMERETLEFENLIREEIYQLVLVEAAKDAHGKFSEDLVSSGNIERNSDIDGEENVVQTVNSLCLDAEENLMLSGNSEIKECEAMDENDFPSLADKLEKGHCLGISVGDLGKVDDQINHTLGIEDDKKQSFLSTLQGFQEVLLDFQRATKEKLETNFSRLDEVKHQTYQLLQLITTMRKRELRYRKAFYSRCHNLRLAEVEVDLLGDQVEVLLDLLEKIYLILNQYSPILSPYFKVSDILKLIKKELIPEVVQ